LVAIETNHEFVHFLREPSRTTGYMSSTVQRRRLMPSWKNEAWHMPTT
jgi:hypothetical protein